MNSTSELPFLFEPAHLELAKVTWELCADCPQDETPSIHWLRKSGLFQWLLPAEGKVSVRNLCLIREALAFTSPCADSVFAVQGLGTHLYAQHFPVADFRAGDNIAGFALTEPGAGSDVASLQTRAVLRGDEWELTGEKVFISNAGIASHYVVFATIDPALGKKGIAAFWVSGDAPGLTVTPMKPSSPHPLGRLNLNSVKTTVQLAKEGEGLKKALETLGVFRVTVGAAALGMARRALQETIEHVTSRKQFGKSLAEQQIVQQYLAEMNVAIQAAGLLVYRAAWQIDQGISDRACVAAAKLFATDKAQEVIDKAVQLHGGLGVMTDSVVEQLSRAVRPLRIYEGTSEIQKLIIARELLGGRL